MRGSSLNESWLRAEDEEGDETMNEGYIPPISYNTYIAASPKRVYETLTSASEWDAWFTQGSSVDARPGGEIVFRWVNFKVDRYTAEAVCPVLEAKPNERLVFQWTPGDSTTTITFTLEALGEGTVVRVVESGHSSSKKDLEALVECAAGWGEALTLLKFYLEHGMTYGEVPEPPDDRESGVPPRGEGIPTTDSDPPPAT
jgi:uncharacterized protein YndB with AHSA1/START domain